MFCFQDKPMNKLAITCKDNPGFQNQSVVFKWKLTKSILENAKMIRCFRTKVILKS